MKPFRQFIFLILAAGVTLSGFAQTNPLYSYFPEKVKMILKINLTSLALKINWQDLMGEDIFKNMQKEFTDDQKSLLKDPGQLGLNLLTGIYVVSPARADGSKSKPILYAAINDTARFAAAIKKLYPGGKIVKSGNFRFVIDKNTAVAWNQDIVVMVTSKSKASADAAPKDIETAKLAQIKELTETCKNLLTKRAMPFNDVRFSSLLKEQGDLFVWNDNSLQSFKKTKNGSSAIAGSINKSLSGSQARMAAAINFEKGKVVMNIKRYVSPHVDSLYQKYPQPQINFELMKKLPAGQPIFVASFAISPDMIYDLFKSGGAAKVIDSLNKKKLKIEDMFSSIKGDVTIAAVKAYEFKEDDSVTQALNGLEVFVAGQIKDKSRFQEFQNSWKEKFADTSIKKKGVKPLLFSNDSFFVVSASAVAAKNFLDNPGSNASFSNLFDLDKTYTHAMLLDLKTIFGFAVQAMSKDKSPEESRQASEALSGFDKLISHGNRLSSTATLTMVNQEDNSIKQIIDMINYFYTIGSKSKKPQVEKN